MFKLKSEERLFFRVALEPSDRLYEAIIHRSGGRTNIERPKEADVVEEKFKSGCQYIEEDRSEERLLSRVALEPSVRLQFSMTDPRGEG